MEAKRLNKFIADSGYCSRREADRLIAEGRVRVDGRVGALGDQVRPGMRVEVDGKPLSGRGERVYLMLNKPVGIVCTADRVKEASPEAMDAAIQSMTTLNKYAAERSWRYDVHACTDVTGFSFLGHLHEMLDGKLSCHVHAQRVPVIPQALDYADEFLLTAAGQRNRNHTGPFVKFDGVPFAMEEVLFDPQTSGGLLIALPGDQAAALRAELRELGLPAEIVGELTERGETEILVTND